MKKIYFSAALVMTGLTCFCQQINLDQFNEERRHISSNGLKLIAAYSAANIIYGSIAQGSAPGSNKYFHQMNTIWNSVTLTLVGIGYLTSKKEGTLTYAESLRKQGKIEKLFLLNAGLDLAYIGGGLYMNEHSKNVVKNSAKLKGYGESVMLQGGVLLLFDGIMYTIHKNHGVKLNKMAENIKFTGTGNGIGFLVKL